MNEFKNEWSSKQSKKKEWKFHSLIEWKIRSPKKKLLLNFPFYWRKKKITTNKFEKEWVVKQKKNQTFFKNFSLSLYFSSILTEEFPLFWHKILPCVCVCVRVFILIRRNSLLTYDYRKPGKRKKWIEIIILSDMTWTINLVAMHILWLFYFIFLFLTNFRP